MQPLAGNRRRGEMQTKKTKSAAASPLPRLSPRLLTRASTIHPPTIFYTNVSVFSIPTTQILPDLSSDGITRPGRSSRPERKTFPQTRSFKSTRDTSSSTKKQEFIFFSLLLSCGFIHPFSSENCIIHDEGTIRFWR